MALTAHQSRRLSESLPRPNPAAEAMAKSLNDWIYENRIFECAKHEFFKLVTSNAPDLIIAVTGTSRSQKSTLVKAVRSALADRALDRGMPDGSFLIDMPATGQAGVDWKDNGYDLYCNRLGALADKVVEIPPLESGALRLGAVRRKKGSPAAYVSAIARDMLREGIPLIIDHADVLLDTGSRNKQLRTDATLRLISARSQRPIVLVGGIDVQVMCSAGKWLAELTRYVEVPPYNADEAGRIEIGAQLVAFEHRITAEFCEADSLSRHAGEATILCDGRIGVLMDALKDAFHDDCVLGHGKLTWQTCERHLKAKSLEERFKIERTTFGNLTIPRLVWNSEEPVPGTTTTGPDSPIAPVKAHDAGTPYNTETGVDKAEASAEIATNEDAQDEASPWGEAADQPTRRRRRRVGHTKASNSPLHTYGTSES